MGTKEEASQAADTTPSSDEHQRPQDLLLETPSSTLEGFVTITVKDVPEEEEKGVLVEVGEDGQTLRMECSCKSGLALAHQQCAPERFTLKGDKISPDVCKQEVDDLYVEHPIGMYHFGGREAAPGVDRWNRDNEEFFRLALVTSLAYFCVVETLTVRPFGFVSTFYTLPTCALMGALTSWASTTLVWSKYVWVYAAVQFGLVLLSAYFIPTGHPDEHPVAFPPRAWYVLNLGTAGSAVSLFCSAIDDCFVEMRRNTPAKRRARSNEVNRLHQRELQIYAQL